MSERAKQGKTIAAIDIGTNTVHMMVVRLGMKTGAFEIVGKKKEYVRLGEYARRGNAMTRAVMKRAVETLGRCKIIADFHHAEILAVATSAVREASNRREFLRSVRRATGIRVRVISWREEARLIYLGVLQALPVYTTKVLVVDIGGGSTEFLIGKKGKPLFAKSLKLGAVRLTQRYFRRGRVSLRAIERCRLSILSALKGVRRAVDKETYDLVVGTSGTIVAFAKAGQIVQRKDRQAGINGHKLSKRTVQTVIRHIIDASLRKRGASFEGLDQRRAEIMLAGSLILEQIFKQLNLRKIVVSKYAIREGVVQDVLETSHRR